MNKFFKRLIITVLILPIVFFIVKNTLFNVYVSKHNTHILSKLKIVNNPNYDKFNAFIHDIESETDWQVYVTSTYRTNQEQARLKKQDKRNASAGQSKHNRAEAIDLVLFQNKGLLQTWVMKESKKGRWEATNVLRIAKKHQLRWGGTFPNYYDPVHFEID